MTPEMHREKIAARAALAAGVLWIIIQTCLAGPLWRDEVHSVNLAAESWNNFWQYFHFDAFPALWLLLLKGWTLAGFADSDLSIRMLGLLTGLAYCAALWFTARSLKVTPTFALTLALCTPTMIYTLTTIRAYGLHCTLMVLTIGLVYRSVTCGGWWWMVVTAIACLLNAHCLYYSGVFIFAILSAGMVLAWRHREKGRVLALLAIGLLSAATLLIYAESVRKASDFNPVLMTNPTFLSFVRRWCKAMALYSWFEGWAWIAAIGVAIGVAVKGLSKRRERNHVPATPVCDQDRLLFCLVLLGVALLGYSAFLIHLGYHTQPWYYASPIIVAAIAMDGIFATHAAGKPASRFRTRFMIAWVLIGSVSLWAATRQRRTNLDLIARQVAAQADPEDLIILDPAFESLTFNRYYNGSAGWITLPPMPSAKYHRYDIIKQRMLDQSWMPTLLEQLRTTLTNGRRVWVVGAPTTTTRPITNPGTPPVPSSNWSDLPFYDYWSWQVGQTLAECGQPLPSSVATPGHFNPKETATVRLVGPR